MPLDAICMTALLNELRGTVVSSRIDKVRQPERDEIILSLRGNGNIRLLISSGAGDARIHFTHAEYENPASPPMFCMLLRKHLTGAKITALTQPKGERAAVFTLSGYDNLGDPEEKQLIVELMGRNSNIILVAADGIIIDCLRRVDPEMSPRRPVLPGLQYHLPPTQEKIDPTELNSADWLREFTAAERDLTLEKWLNITFTSLSPLICREIAHRAYDHAEITVAQAHERDGGAALCDCAATLMRDAATSASPYILVDNDGRARDYSYTEITQYGSKMTVEREAGFSDLLERFYTRRAAEERGRSRASALTRTVKNALARAERRVNAQRTELAAAGDREQMRICGDLITANIYRMKKGESCLRAQDFYADNVEREIALDIRKTPQQNAAKYYRDYTKAKNAETILAERIEHGVREITYLESVIAMLAMITTERELDDIRRELMETGYVRREKTSAKQKIKPAAPYRFTTKSGAEVFVGRSNVQNDELTFRTAYKSDVWLHVKDRHGSHVILRTGGTAPLDDDIESAAALAAYYSEARNDRRVAVDYCAVKHVKKISGAGLGMVTYTDYKTVIAAPLAEI